MRVARFIPLAFTAWFIVGQAQAQAQVNYQILHGFENPPRAPLNLVRGSDGALYGLTAQGGNGADSSTEGWGTVFKIQEDGSGFRKLHDFTQANGALANTLIKGSGAWLYGATASGGQWGWGTVFKINEDGSNFETLHHFEGHAVVDRRGAYYAGRFPNALVQSPDGTLYGTTEGGGTSDLGTIFRINADGSGFETLHAFRGGPARRAGLYGAYPNTLVMGSDGRLYGTTSSGGSFLYYGTVFRIDRDGRRFEKLHDFDEANGNGPHSLTQGSDGTLYGTTAWGGAWGNGTLFRIDEHGSRPCSCFEKLHDFDGANGSFPGALSRGADGALYGTAAGGGTPGRGIVFKINADGSAFAKLHDFVGPDGAQPSGALVKATDGALYGVTLAGGTTAYSGGTSGGGTVFTINEAGSGFLKVYVFDWGYGAFPNAGLVEGSDGALYGTTYGGVHTGASSDGTVFKIGKDGSGLQKLYGFNGADGAKPSSTLVKGADGALYGTTEEGGTFGEGTVFKMQEDGSGFRKLHDFDHASGSYPGGLVAGPDGTLYGTTSFGPMSGYGSLFRIQGDGSGFETLHEFDGSSGGAIPSPRALVLGVDGALYGTTNGGGTGSQGILFRINADGSGFQTLHEFDGVSGASPSTMLQGSDGMLYGTTAVGGASGYGTLFRIGQDGSAFQKLHDFDGAGGANPAALTRGADGALYGTAGGGTSGWGTLFRINEDGSGFLKLRDFEWESGAGPNSLVTGSDRALYGTTFSGGPGAGGVVFQIGFD